MYKALLICTLVLTFTFVACSEKTPPDPMDVVVARVGERQITVRDFKRNYEFGPPHLKREPDRKRSYLDFMIKELVLAQQGYRLHLDESERVRSLENELRQELLIEALFDNEVKSKISVSDDEIHDAISKSKVQWKMRFWYEPDLEHARHVCQAMREEGYARVVENILRSNPEIKVDPKYFESKYMTWLEVEPVVLEAIKDLPIGEISDPVKINGGYYLFQVVDIRRGALTDYEYKERAESFRQILFYRKLNDEAINYVSAMMTPKNVVTKGTAFKKLSVAFQYWQKKKDKKEFLQAVLSAGADDEPLYDLQKNLQQTLVSFDDKHWTIRDYLASFDPKSINTKPGKAAVDIRPLLSDNIAVTVRNDYMIQEAKIKNLDESPAVIYELQHWKDKWVYEETRHYYTQDLKIDEMQARLFFEENPDRFKIRWDDEPKFEDNINLAKRLAYIEMARSRLDQEVDRLTGSDMPVIINQAVLDSIETVDFKSSRWASLQVFKRSNNRLAFPAADPAWGF